MSRIANGNTDIHAVMENQSFKKLAVKGVASYSTQNILLQFVWFFTSLILLNSISVADYSILKLILAAVAVPSAMYIAGLDPIILSDLGVEREKGRLGVVKGLFQSYIIFEIVSAVLIWSGFILTIKFIGHVFDPATRSYLFVASFLIFVRPLQNIFIQFFNLFFHFKQVTLVKFYAEAGILLGLAYFVWYAHQGLYTALLVQVVVPFIAITLSFPVFFSVYRKELSHVKTESGGFFSRIKAHGKWSIAAAYVLKASDGLRLFFIDRFIGREAVAIFSLADGLWNRVVSIFPIKTVLDAMLPQRSQDEGAARRSLVSGSKYAFLGLAGLGLVAAIVGYPFLSVFFPKYMSAFPVFLGFLLMIPRVSFSSALGPLLRAYRFQRSGFFGALASIILSTVLAFVLYPLFGMVGVVAEVVVSSALLIQIVYISFVKQYPVFKIRMKEFFTWDQNDREMVSLIMKRVMRRSRVSS